MISATVSHAAVLVWFAEIREKITPMKSGTTKRLISSRNSTYNPTVLVSVGSAGFEEKSSRDRPPQLACSMSLARMESFNALLRSTLLGLRAWVYLLSVDCKMDTGHDMSVQEAGITRGELDENWG